VQIPPPQYLRASDDKKAEPAFTLPNTLHISDDNKVEPDLQELGLLNKFLLRYQPTIPRPSLFRRSTQHTTKEHKSPPLSHLR